MQAFPAPLAVTADGAGTSRRPDLTCLPGPVTRVRDRQALFASETLPRALRQLEVYGSDGLPVLSGDGQHIQGWVTGASVLHAIARRIRATGPQAPRGQPAAGRALPGPASAPQQPPMPLGGYQVLEITISHDSPASGKALGVISWPPAAPRCRSSTTGSSATWVLASS